VALRTKLLVRDEQVLLLAIAGAHCHTVFVHHRRSAVDLDQVFRSSGKQQARLLLIGTKTTGCWGHVHVAEEGKTLQPLDKNPNRPILL
jgi:hypothetical protein